MNSVAVLLPIVVAAASTSAAQAASPVEFIISDAGRELVDRVAEDVFSERALLLKYTVGTMIELL